MWFPDLWMFVSRLVERAKLRGRRQTALSLANAYVRLHPRDPHAWTIKEKAVRYFEGEAAAEDVLREAAAHLPMSDRIGLALARSLCRQKRLEEAEHVLETMTARHPDSPRTALGWLFLAAARKRWDEFDLWAKRTEERLNLPKDVDDLLSLAVATYTAPGRRERGKRLLLRAAKIAEANSFAYEVLGVALEEDNPSEAARYIDHARQVFLGPKEVFDQQLAEHRRRVKRWREST